VFSSTYGCPSDIVDNMTLFIRPRKIRWTIGTPFHLLRQE
jgi:hypothetical protein